MPLPHPRSFRLRPASRLALAMTAVILLSACSTSIAGSAIPSANGATSAPTTGGPITEPSAVPGMATPSGTPTVPTSTGSGTTSPSTSTTTVPGAVPAGLGKYYAQQLAWGPCAGYATDADSAQLYQSSSIQCARLTVPLAYADPTGPTVTIGVLRKVATDPSARIGSLVTDPGGPGASGMAWLASYTAGLGAAKQNSAEATLASLNQKFDLVGIDPRGVGSALPAVDCQTDAEKDADRAFDARSRTAADVATANAVTAHQVAECVANTGKAQGIDGKTFLANIGTRDVARDLDVLRAVLGDKKLTYLGFSYGTEIGWEYAAQFPANVRAILFDGVVSPIADPATLAIGQNAGFETAFANFASWCATSYPGCALGTDPSKSLAAYQALVRPLLDHHLTLSDGRAISFGDAVTGTTMGLYFTQYQTTLAKALVNLRNGSGDLLMGLADAYDGRDAKGHYTNEDEAFQAVTCVDQPRMTDPAEVTKLRAQLDAARPYAATGDPVGAILDPCAYWPVPPTLTPHRLDIPGLPKTLVVSTTGDPATPYQSGVELADEIGATLLTAKGVRHTSYLTSGVTCVDTIGTTYLETLALPATGATCS